jgi:ankyrin repeat protein
MVASVPSQTTGATPSYCMASSDVNTAQYLKPPDLTRLQYQLAHAQAQQLQLVLQQQQPPGAQPVMQQTQLSPAQKRLARVQVSQGSSMPLTHGAVAMSQTVIEAQTALGTGVVLPQAFGTGAVMPVTFDGGGALGPLTQMVPVTVSSGNGKLLTSDNKMQQFQLTSHQSVSTTSASAIDATQLLKTTVGFECAGDIVTPMSPSVPLSPNPPASPVMTPPVYPMSIEVDAQTEANHDTALTLACAGGHAELVSLLLARGANIEHRDKKGFTPLIHAATGGHVAVCEILLDNGADIEAQTERTKDTALSLACSGGRHEIVELLLRRNANREHRNVSDYTPLALAASGGYLTIIRLLLSYGAEINSRTGSKLGISPLMLAAMNGHAAAVSLLADMGSDINAQIETNRNTALTLACFQGRHEVVSILIDKRANIEHRAKTGLTPLMEAASGGYVEVGRVLLDKGADIAAAPVPSSRDTALTIAADKGHYRFVELLLSRGAAVDVKNKKGQTALWLACNGGHLDVVQLLVTAHASTDIQDQRKVSCLMAAFRCGHVKVVRWLVRHVTQFPSDSECQRFIASIADADLLKRCQQCMEVIIVAKERQAAEANKNAAFLLEEIESERNREESKRVKAAKKREKKRQKKREKQGRENDSADKPELDDELDRNEEDDEDDGVGHSANDPVTEMMKVQQAAAQNERERASASLSLDNGVENGRSSAKKSRKTKKNQTKTGVADDSVRSEMTKATTLVLAVVAGASANGDIAKPASSVASVLGAKPPVATANSIADVVRNASGVTGARTVNSSQSGHDVSSQFASMHLSKTGAVPTSSAHDANRPNVTLSISSASLTTTAADVGKQSAVKSTPFVSYVSAATDGSKLPVGLSVGQKEAAAKNKASSKTAAKVKDASSSSVGMACPMSTGIGDLDDFGILPSLKPAASVTRERVDTTPVSSSVKLLVAVTRTTSRPAAASVLISNATKQSSSAVVTSTGNKKAKGGTAAGGTRKHDDDPLKKIVRIQVPAKAISRIIGRAGCNINAIRDATGAQVDLDKMKNSSDAMVTIRGAQDPVREAHDLVFALIRESDKDIDQLIPQMKRQVTVPVAPAPAPAASLIIPAPPPPSNVWKNNMAKSIPASTILAQSLTTSASSNPGSAKSSVAVPVTTSSTDTSHSTVTNSVAGLPADYVKPQPIGAFPIGAWTPVTTTSSAHNKRSPNVTTSAVVGGGRKEPAVNTSSKSVPSTVGESSPTALLSKPPVSVSDTVSANGVSNVTVGPKTPDKTDTVQTESGHISSLSPVATQIAPPVSSVPNTSEESQAKVPSGGGDYVPFSSVFEIAKMSLRPREIQLQLGSIISQSEIDRVTAETNVTAASSSMEAEALQAKAPGYRPQPRTASPRTADVIKRAGNNETPIPPIKMPSPSIDVTATGVNSAVAVSVDSPRSFLPFADASVGMTLLNSAKSPAERTDDGIQTAAAQYREEYISSKNPMTLPRIDSNLNPNAPDFTSKKTAAGVSESQLAPTGAFMYNQHPPQQSQQQQHLQMAQQTMPFQMQFAPPQPAASVSSLQPSQVYGAPPQLPPHLYSLPGSAQANGGENASPQSHAYMPMGSRPPAPPSVMSRITQLQSGSVVSGAFGPSFVQRGEPSQTTGQDLAGLNPISDANSHNQPYIPGHSVQPGMFVQGETCE